MKEPVDPVPRAATLEFVAGSHLGPWRLPRTFLDDLHDELPDGAPLDHPLFPLLLDEPDRVAGVWKAGRVRTRPSARPATRIDLDPAAHTLRRAFDDDPVMRWLMPRADARAAAMPGFYRALAGIALEHGTMWVADAPGRPAAGVGVWLPPGAWPVPNRRSLGIVGPSLRGMGRHAIDGIRTVAAMDRRHHEVAEPHWYLEILGSDPGVRGGGYGEAVLQPVLERCDREGLAAYLESSKPENLPYYERYGWKVVEEFRVRPGAPPLWTMLRPAP